jgi:hypothetical protein
MPASSPSLTNGLHSSESIELLTKQALEAARAGDWDRVDACYTEREMSLKATVVDRAVAQRLLAIDEQVRAAALVAQAGIAGLLADTAQMKRQLRRLKDISGQVSATSGTMHLEA